MEIALLGACAFILIFNLVMALIRGMRKSLLRLGTVVVAAVVAFFLSRTIAGNFGTEIALWLQATAGINTDFAPLFEGAASAADAIALFVRMLLAPALFLLLYIVLKGVLILVYWVLANATRPPYRDTVKGHFAALLVGLAIGLIGVMALVSPVFGYLDIASNAIPATATDAESDNGLDAELIESAKDTPVISALYNAIGVHVFEGLSAGEWQGADVQLKEEIAVLADIVENIKVPLGTQPQQYGEAECAAIEAVAGDVTHSPILASLCSGVLNTASNHWLSGTPFLGVSAPDMGASGNTLFRAFLTVFSTSSEENLGQDLDFFSDVFALLVKYEIFADISTADDEGLAALITNGDFLKDVGVLLDTHPRMQPVGTAFADVGMRALLKAAGLPENIGEERAELLAEMASVLQATPAKADGSIDQEALAAGIGDVCAEHEIEISDATAQLVAEGLADHFTAEELRTLTAEQIAEELAVRFEAVNVEDLIAAKGQ